MKCLEMIKHNLDLCEKGDTDYGFVYKSELEQIKFHLEVLEIIRKKDVNLTTLKLCIMRTDTIEQLLSKYNKSRYFTQDELTMEELLKLKKWLEGNEK